MDNWTRTLPSWASDCSIKIGVNSKSFKSDESLSTSETNFVTSSFNVSTSAVLAFIVANLFFKSALALSVILSWIICCCVDRIKFKLSSPTSSKLFAAKFASSICVCIVPFTFNNCVFCKAENFIKLELVIEGLRVFNSLFAAVMAVLYWAIFVLYLCVYEFAISNLSVNWLLLALTSWIMSHLASSDIGNFNLFNNVNVSSFSFVITPVRSSKFL